MNFIPELSIISLNRPLIKKNGGGYLPSIACLVLLNMGIFGRFWNYWLEHSFFRKLYGNMVWDHLKPYQKFLFIISLPLDILTILIILFVVVAFVLDEFFGIYI